MKHYFTRMEWILWTGSVVLVTGAFLLSGGSGWMSLAASLVGVTSLIFAAKGNPLGQALMIVFSLLYGCISLTFSYYGEMITYLGMTAPMAVISLISWLRNPYEGKRAQVRISRVGRGEAVFLCFLTAAVTAVFYCILRYFHTANLVPSTISVATSFAAAYLTFRRSAAFAAAYALNDMVLLVLWGMASVQDGQYISVFVCFAAFLVNDIYGFVNWRSIRRQQEGGSDPYERDTPKVKGMV